MLQSELLRYAVNVLDRHGIAYAIVGSFASGTWGEPRMTRDVDIVVRLTSDQVRPLCDAFPSDEFYVSEPAVHEAIGRQSQFNVIHPTSGNKIDFMVVGGRGWHAAQLSRRQKVELVPGCEGYIAAPEDVILGKLLYYHEGGSEKHLRDIAGILKISGSVVDREYVARHARDLGVAEIWHAIVERVDRSV